MEAEERKKYASANLCFDIMKTEYDYELNRSSKLDNKINITLTLCGVLFLYIMKFFNIIGVLNKESVFNSQNVTTFFVIVSALIYIAIIVFYLKAILKLIALLNPLNYLHINCDEIFDKALISEPDDITAYYISTKYLAATAKNAETNNSRSKDYAKVVIFLKIMLIFCFIAEIVSNILLK